MVPILVKLVVIVSLFNSFFPLLLKVIFTLNFEFHRENYIFFFFGAVGLIPEV